MDQKLRDLLERVLKTTTPLVQVGASHDTKFLNVLLGIYRVSFTTLRDVFYLSQNEDAGASALDLTRKLIEYGITVEYMVWRGKEEMAEQFQKHMWSELSHEIEFLKSIGQDLKVQSAELKIGVEEVEREYAALNSKERDRKSWAGLSIEQMMQAMHDAGHLKDFDFSRLSQAYIWGCRLNHISPFVVHHYMGPDEAEGASDFYLRQAIVFGVLFHLRLSTRYIDEINSLNGADPTPDLTKSILALRDEFELFDQKN